MGRQSLIVANLAPKRMFGEVSKAMLVDIGYADRIAPVFDQLEKMFQMGRE